MTSTRIQLQTRLTPQSRSTRRAVATSRAADLGRRTPRKRPRSTPARPSQPTPFHAQEEPFLKREEVGDGRRADIERPRSAPSRWRADATWRSSKNLGPNCRSYLMAKRQGIPGLSRGKSGAPVQHVPPNTLTVGDRSAFSRRTNRQRASRVEVRWLTPYELADRRTAAGLSPLPPSARLDETRAARSQSGDSG
jgi:hypothetical protein